MADRTVQTEPSQGRQGAPAGEGLREKRGLARRIRSHKGPVYVVAVLGDGVDVPVQVSKRAAYRVLRGIPGRSPVACGTVARCLLIGAQGR